MRVVIIGGGIAGLSLGVFLRDKNIDVVVNERSKGMPIRGHAFLMHSDGVNTLNELNNFQNPVLQGSGISSFSLKRPKGKEIRNFKLDSWQCFKRCTLIEYLYSIFPNRQIKEGREFSHFIYENNKVVAAAFINGDVEYGDVFVGADGGNSKVRESIFGKVEFTPVRVKEVVGVAFNPKISNEFSGKFSKYQKKKKGIAFGFIPTSENELVWFMQYDPAISDLTASTPDELKSFCRGMLEDFPPVVHEIIESNDFSTSYIWNTRDFDLLPSFHHQNVALIGDAAHLALPFTSAGTTNAIMDAKTLTQCLKDSFGYEKAFEDYYKLRSTEVAKHIKLGRDLQQIFLNPDYQKEDNIPIPLISCNEEDQAKTQKPIQVVYFTDPICSTCWGIQPILRKLKLEYGHILNFQYKMGGLLPSWEEYKKGKISQPSDAAKHWEEVCTTYDMPLDGDVWLEDPLSSSYPPSIAFKAAQMQDEEKAVLFLRRIQEMVILEKKNIIKWEYLKKAAFEVGLDSARLLRDFEGKAQDNFRDDLKLAEKLGVTSFPTFFFNGNNHSFTIKGYQSYEKFEEVIRNIEPSAQKQKIDSSPRFLFTKFLHMTDKEFAFLSNRFKEEANQVLNALFEKGNIDKFESKNGTIWKSKFSTPLALPSTYIKVEGNYLTAKAPDLDEILCGTGSNITNGSCEIKPFKAKASLEYLKNEFEEKSPLFKGFCSELKRQISAIIEKENIKLAAPVQEREKHWKSIESKIKSGKFPVHASVLEVEDLVGIRIVLLFKKDAEKLAGLIKENFRLYKESNPEVIIIPGQKGLSTLHQVIELNENWLKIPTLNAYKGLKAEIQIRTSVQHTWAESSKFFDFGDAKNFPEPIGNSLNRLSGLLENVDSEIETAQRLFMDFQNKKDNKETADIKNDSQNLEKLTELLLNKLPQETREKYNVSKLIHELQGLNMNGKH